MILIVMLMAAGTGLAIGFYFGRASAMPGERKNKRRLRVAERHLRAIANGAGAPQLEAQLALDEIDKDIA